MATIFDEGGPANVVFADRDTVSFFNWAFVVAFSMFIVENAGAFLWM